MAQASDRALSLAKSPAEPWGLLLHPNRKEGLDGQLQDLPQRVNIVNTLNSNTEVTPLRWFWVERRSPWGGATTRSECVTFFRPQATDSVGQCEISYLSDLDFQLQKRDLNNLVRVPPKLVCIDA